MRVNEGARWFAPFALTSTRQGIRSVVDQIVLTSRKPEVMSQKNSQRSWPEVGLEEVRSQNARSPVWILLEARFWITFRVGRQYVRLRSLNFEGQ